MKKIISLALIFALSAVMLCACGKTDYSQYSFTDKRFIRETKVDTENIRFYSDGSFSYFYGCGDPVGDADLVKKYTYDEETNTVTLSYGFGKSDNAIETIKIVEYSDTSITLDFDGDIRIFTVDSE